MTLQRLESPLSLPATPAGTAEPPVDFGPAAATLWQGRTTIALVTLLALLAGAWQAWFGAVPIYRASAVVMLDTTERSVIDLGAVTGRLTGESSEMNSEVQVLRARGLMGQVVEALDLAAHPDFAAPPGPLLPFTGRPAPAADPELRHARAVTALSERVQVRNLPRSMVFEITAEAADPRLAARIADTIAETYVANQVTRKVADIARARDFLAGRVRDLRGRLETAEAARADFRAATDLVSPEALVAAEQQLKELRARIATAETARIEGRARLATLRAAADAPAARRATLAEDARLDRILAREGPGAPFDARFGQLLEAAALEQARAAEQLAALRDSAAELAARIDSQSADLIALQQLDREADSVRQLYESFLTRLNETAAQQGLQRADSRILSRAVRPDRPARPRRALILGLALAAGLVTGAALVVLREIRQATFRTAAQLERATGLPVLGEIPLLPSRRRRRALHHLAGKPASAASEAVRSLRTSLGLTGGTGAEGPQVILATSALPGEGKTTTALALARSLAGLGKRVVLVEADIRRRSLHRYFDLDEPPAGLVSVLEEGMPAEAAVIHDPLTGIDLLLGQEAGRNAADLLSSEATETLLARLRQLYDVVILDTPPVALVPDARILAPRADAVLVVVRWNVTPRARVARVLTQLRAGRAPLAGLVLGQVNPRGQRRYGEGLPRGGAGYYRD